MAEKEYIERGAVVAMLRTITIRITPIEENRDRFYHDSGWNGASVGARVEVGKIPAADVVEVVHARWEKIHDDPSVNKYRCTNCKAEKMRDNYCPNCGAKMDGVTDNNVGDK